MYFVQGYVAFSSQGDRIALTQIEQVVNGTYVKLGYYDTQSDNLTWFNRENWQGKLCWAILKIKSLKLVITKFKYSLYAKSF